MQDRDTWVKKRKKGLKLISNSVRVQQVELTKQGIDVSREVDLIEAILFEIAVKL